jgi:hypothetical protein
MLLQAIEHSTVLICYRNIIDRWLVPFTDKIMLHKGVLKQLSVGLVQVSTGVDT